MTQEPMSQGYLVRETTTVRRDNAGITLRLRAVSCSKTPGMPGYLTGESLEVQGIESALPNLPDLDLPHLDELALVLRLTVCAADTIRLTLAPEGAWALDDDGTGLGIVTDPAPAPEDFEVTESAAAFELTTSRVRVIVGRERFRIEVRDVDTGDLRLRTSESLRQAAGLPMAPAVLTDGERITVHLLLAADEQVLGFGEQFSPLVKNGQRLVLRSEDALGTGTGLAYKPVPVWHSTAGYTGFLNTGAVVTANVGHSRPSVLGLTVDDAAFDLYLFASGSPKDRLSAYTALTGRAAVPPLWSFGYWMGRCRYHSAGEMLEVAATMRKHEVPCDVLHLDPDWLVVDRLNCDFIWNHDRFGDRQTFVAALEDLGVRLSVWELPYLDPASPRYAEAEANGYLVPGDDGPAHVAKTPTPDGRPRALVDFGNPQARRWWQELHREFLADGVAAFKTDFGEGLPDVGLGDGTPPNQSHNLYPLRYNGAVSDAIGELTGRAPLVWGRSGWAGSHRYPGQWGGDAESTVAGMQATLRGGLSYALSAPGLWSHDIGGFFGPDLTPELYVRWTQFGALSPLMRAHGLRPREPWAFDERTLELTRAWIRLRYELMPYLWQVVHESLEHGWPVLRPLGLEFPEDPTAAGLDSQFLLGSDLLVVPIFDDGAEPVRRRFYVPAGGWTALLTGERFEGPGYVTREVPLDSMPVLVRDGAVVPRVDLTPEVRRTDDLVGLPWTLHLYGHTTEVACDLVGFDGTTSSASVSRDDVRVNGSQPVAARAVRHG